jgi:hypothetical protein
MKQTVDLMAMVVDIARELNINQVVFNPVDINSQCYSRMQLNEYGWLDVNILGLQHQIEKISGYKNILIFLDSDKLLKYFIRNQDFLFDCKYHDNRIAVKPDGSYYICDGSSYPGIKFNLSEYWKSSFLNNLRMKSKSCNIRCLQVCAY